MTKALYLDDSYLKECDATVESVAAKEVVLDQTVFYPRGGGQPADTGKLITPSGSEFRVLNVVKKEGKIMHELDREPKPETGDSELAPGSRVRCIIDWERRYALMRMHTAAHVLAAVMHRELGALISGNQLETDKTRFDFTLADFDRGKFDEAVKKANDELSRDVQLKTYALPREEAMKIPGVVKLAGALPPAISELRIVEICDVDVQADGGTHVRSLKEVGKIQILKLENKGKENRRIYFTLTS
jgi:misacylated tRNA(Ala) deacylase